MKQKTNLFTLLVVSAWFLMIPVIISISCAVFLVELNFVSDDNFWTVALVTFFVIFALLIFDIVRTWMSKES